MNAAGRHAVLLFAVCRSRPESPVRPPSRNQGIQHPAPTGPKGNCSTTRKTSATTSTIRPISSMQRPFRSEWKSTPCSRENQTGCRRNRSPRTRATRQIRPRQDTSRARQLLADEDRLREICPRRCRVDSGSEPTDGSTSRRNLPHYLVKMQGGSMIRSTTPTSRGVTRTVEKAEQDWPSQESRSR